MEAEADSTILTATETIIVKTGERIRRFGERLEKDSLTTLEAIIRVAGQELEAEHPLLPAPLADSISRFEGMFKPGSYTIFIEKLHPEDSTLYSQQAIENARAIIDTLLAESASHFSLLDTSAGLTPYQKVILASIVEKEAVKNQCYDSITSVFYNRLKYNYPLASCVSVEYALGYHRPFLTLTDIKTESPYNLYINTGLTPTPLCFVSEEALAAVQDPIETDLRYFVYDWTDHSIHFATTDSIHEINCEKARSNYIRTFGRENIRKKYYGVFYEVVED